MIPRIALDFLAIVDDPYASNPSVGERGPNQQRGNQPGGQPPPRGQTPVEWARLRGVVG